MKESVQEMDRKTAEWVVATFPADTVYVLPSVSSTVQRLQRLQPFVARCARIAFALRRGNAETQAFIAEYRQ